MVPGTAPRSRAWRRRGIPVERATAFGPWLLPPAPRVSLAAPRDVPLAVRSDLENPRLSPVDGRTHLRLTIVGGAMARPPRPATVPVARARSPVTVWLYLDASGSMVGEPAHAARAAAHVLVRRLHREDRLGIVAYGEDPRVLRAPRPVGDAIGAHRAIDALPLGGGEPPDGPPSVAVPGGGGDVPLVLWITDGVGFAEANARRVADAAPVVAFVVGDGASAADLQALRDVGVDPRHVPDARALVPSLGRELTVHRAAVARDVEITVAPAPGVRIARVYGGATYGRGGATVRVPSLGRGEERIVLLELESGPGVAGASTRLADFDVTYRDASTLSKERIEGEARAVRARDGDEALATRDRGVVRSVLAVRTGAAFASAGEALARHEPDEARRVLVDHAELLTLAAASLGDPWIYRDADVTRAYATTVRRMHAMLDEGARQRLAARMFSEGEGRMRR